MKSTEITEATRLAFQKLADRVPGFALGDVQRDVEVSPGQPPLELLLTVRHGDVDWSVAVVTLAQAQPREARIAMLQLEHFLHRLPKPCYGVLAAPFLSERAAELCALNGIGAIDLVGNRFLQFGSLFIEIRVPGNPNYAKREARTLFSPKAERVLFQLLTPPIRHWKVVELAEAAQVSIGHVSAVRKMLLSREWAEASSDGLRLIAPKTIAETWSAAYHPRISSITRSRTVLHGDELQNALQTALYEAGRGEHAVLASYSAAQRYTAEVRHGTLYLYADARGQEALLSRLQLEPAGSAANVILYDPKHNVPFHDRIEAAPGLWATHPILTWLDLRTEGPRGKEAALLLQQQTLSGWE